MTSTDWFEIVIVLFCILAVAVMAASEVALTRTNRVRAMRLLEERKSRSAEQLVKITENPAPYLNVVLLITLLATITKPNNASFGEPAPSRYIRPT